MNLSQHEIPESEKALLSLNITGILADAGNTFPARGGGKSKNRRAGGWLQKLQQGAKLRSGDQPFTQLPPLL
jgi:hypothetical protein